MRMQAGCACGSGDSRICVQARIVSRNTVLQRTSPVRAIPLRPRWRLCFLFPGRVQRLGTSPGGPYLGFGHQRVRLNHPCTHVKVPKEDSVNPKPATPRLSGGNSALRSDLLAGPVRDLPGSVHPATFPFPRGAGAFRLGFPMFLYFFGNLTRSTAQHLTPCSNESGEQDVKMTNGVPPMPVGPTGPPIGIHGPERSYSVDIIVCSVITSVIGTAFVGLRFYTRAVLRRVLGLEDWLILIAQVRAEPGP